jgi:hypothetical protein
MDFSQVGVVTVLLAFGSLILSAAAVNHMARRPGLTTAIYPIGLTLSILIGTALVVSAHGVLGGRILIWAGASLIGAVGARAGILA